MDNRNTVSKIMKRNFLFLLFFVLFLFHSITVSAHDTDYDEFPSKRVLFISSYSPAFNTFYDQINGMNDVFDGYPVTVDMEFMDSKRFLTEENINKFYDSLSYKMSRVDYDIVMVSDDNGFDFVMEHHDTLFKDLPVVFFGVNDKQHAIDESLDPLVTGVIEHISINETIQLGIDMNKTATKIVALVDATPTGRQDLESFYAVQDNFPSLAFQDIDLSEMSYSSFLTEIEKIEDDTIVLLLAALTDGDGNTYDFDRSVKDILAVSNQPVYHLYEHGVEDGLLGGKVVSHYKQGEVAAKMVLRYFLGEDFSSIQLLEESPNIYLMNYHMVTFFELDEKQAPEGTQFLSRELTFFEEYQTLIFYIGSLVVFLIAVIIVLIWSTNNRNKARLEAVKSKEELEVLNEKLLYTSFHDSLTGLKNRAYYEDVLEKSNTPENYPLSIVLGDVNGLKLLNDAFGHLIGDKAIIETARLLTEVFEEDDVIARIGGDEFVVIMIGKPEEYVFEKMEIIRKRSKIIEIEGVYLSMSLGYAIKEDDSKTLNDMFTEAEDWMYREKLNQVPSNRSNTIHAIIETINQKDEYSQLHSRRVSILATKIAELIGLDSNSILEIKTAGLLHDVGKIIVPTNILNKKGPLTEEEYNEIKKHSEIGFRILNSVSSMRNLAEYVLYHHERIDGKGYPHGIKGKDIPLQSRIIAIADAMDAMVNVRLYREPLSKDDCFEELKRCSGTQFCKDVVDVVLEHYDDIYLMAKDEKEK